MNNASPHDSGFRHDLRLLARQLGGLILILLLILGGIQGVALAQTGFNPALAWQTMTQWLLTHLPEVHAGSPLLWILCPGILMLALAGTMLLLYRQPPFWLRLLVGALFLLLQVAYLSFRLVATLSLGTAPDAILSVSFFLSEVFIHLRIALGNLSLLKITDRSAQADAAARLVRHKNFQPRIDVFVPTYSESVAMLRRTLIGCQAMDYPQKTIYLLDDQRRPEMKDLAEELGCQYLDRPDNRHAKAGNINHALKHSDGELIVCFDADFVPTRDFIERTIGFFADPDMALVQTPQNFFNEDAATRNLGLEGVLEDEQRFFFRTIQPGRDALNAIVCHGSCFVIRRAALLAIGGVPTETITEDWATSLKLQAAGYKMVYLNEPLSAGVSADRCGEFLQQRSRWAQGTLQSLFASTNPLTLPGLNWKQRLAHLSGILYYMGSLCHLFCLIAPLFYLFFGLHLLRISVPEILFYRLPFLIGYYMLFSWITVKNRSAIWTEFYDAFLAPTLSWTVLRSLIRPFGSGFKVTDKSGGQSGVRLNSQACWPFVILLVLHLAGLAYAVQAGRYFEDADLFAIVTYFTVSNVIVLWLCIQVTIDVGRAHPHTRFNHQIPGDLQLASTRLQGRTLSLSEGDFVFKPDAISAKLRPGCGTLSLPSLDLMDLPVRLDPDRDSGSLRLTLVQPSLKQQRRLIDFLYCQPGRWVRRHKPKSEWRAIGEYYRSVLRMYPLAVAR